MNWSTVKNLLIAILVAANLFLIFNIVRRDRSRQYLDEKTVSDAISLLSDRGLSVDESCVPLRKFDASVYESSYNDEYYTGVAKRLSGAEREILLSLPSGGFSITCAGGAVVDFDGEFGFMYMGNDNFGQRAYTDITSDNIDSYAKNGTEPKGSEKRKLTKLASSFLTAQDTEGNAPEAEITNIFSDEETGLTYVFAVQKLNEYPVNSHYAVCVFDGEAVIGAYGRWFFSDFGEVHSVELWDQINILFADMEALKSDGSSTAERADNGGSVGADGEDAADGAELPSVKSMEACYVAYWNADKTSLYFIPAWLIGHSDGQTTLYNALNGTVYSKKQ